MKGWSGSIGASQVIPTVPTLQTVVLNESPFVPVGKEPRRPLATRFVMPRIRASSPLIVLLWARVVPARLQTSKPTTTCRMTGLLGTPRERTEGFAQERAGNLLLVRR